jgi:putative transposase
MRGRRRRGTTPRGKRAAPAEDLLKRNIAATKMDKIWVADFTYVATKEGFLYLAFILDLHSRKVVGWAMESHLRTELVVDALQMAVWRRKPAPGLVHHSDQGVQYTALSFAERLREVGIKPSMGRTGSALDNAMAESPWFESRQAHHDVHLHPADRICRHPVLYAHILLPEGFLISSQSSTR